MTPNTFATQLRNLREIEKRSGKDMTERSLAVLSGRVTTIEDGPGTQEQKDALVARTERQYLVFMGRAIPEIPF